MSTERTRLPGSEAGWAAGLGRAVPSRQHGRAWPGLLRANAQPGESLPCRAYMLLGENKGWGGKQEKRDLPRATQQPGAGSGPWQPLCQPGVLTLFLQAFIMA